jgi:hypothetical protein
MRGFSACKTFLSIATLSGAAIFSLTASATTLEPIVAYRLPRGGTIIRIAVIGNSPTGYVDITAFDPTAPNHFPGHVIVVNGVASTSTYLGTNSPVWDGPFVVTADYEGDAANPPASLTFTVTPPTQDWIPTVIEHLLSD